MSAHPTRLIKVLRVAGHYSDARTVAIEFEWRKRRAGRLGSRYRKCFHWVYGLLADYGYRPLKIVVWMLSVWFVCGLWYFYAANQGVFSPSNPLVFQHERYTECRAERDSKNTALKSWYGCAALSDEYTTFSPLAYSLDLILPLVDLQQERDWAPMIPTPQSQVGGEGWISQTWTSARAAVMDVLSFSLNHFTRLVMWAEILFGWVASLLLVVVFTGMAKRDEE